MDLKIPGQAHVLIKEARISQSISARSGSIAVGERGRRDEGIYVDKGSDSSISFELHIPGKGRIIAGPACARLRHIAVRGEGPERRSRGVPGDPGDTPSTHHRADDFVFWIELSP